MRLGKTALLEPHRRKGVSPLQSSPRQTLLVKSENHSQWGILFPPHVLEFIPIKPSVAMALDGLERYAAHRRLP
jgi:hypothetical protein